MLSFLPNQIIGFLAFLFYVVNTLFWFFPVIICSLLKAIVPIRWWRHLFSVLLDLMATGWISVNTLIQRLTTKTKITTQIDGELSTKQWYLVVSNHQSWVDILVLQRVLNGKIPFLKFFLKSQLIWVPFLGIAWWALDFPFMKRYSKAYIEKNPHLKGKDIASTKKACAKFKYKPVSVMNFVEGTRFTPSKHQKQGSSFKHLLKPKAGGAAFVLHAMGDYLTHLVNVSIYYPEGSPTFWQFASGQVKEIVVDIDVSPIQDDLKGDYFNDEAFQSSFQLWLNNLWQEKDNTLTNLANFNKNKE